jgi:hypothetical protein
MPKPAPRPKPQPPARTPQPPPLEKAPPDSSPAETERNLVAALFRSPQNLAAAFIAAEVLALPVSLRRD